MQPIRRNASGSSARQSARQQRASYVSCQLICVDMTISTAQPTIASQPASERPRPPQMAILSFITRRTRDQIALVRMALIKFGMLTTQLAIHNLHGA